MAVDHVINHGMTMTKVARIQPNLGRLIVASIIIAFLQTFSYKIETKPNIINHPIMSRVWRIYNDSICLFPSPYVVQVLDAGQRGTNDFFLLPTLFAAVSYYRAVGYGERKKCLTVPPNVQCHLHSLQHVKLQVFLTAPVEAEADS